MPLGNGRLGLAVWAQEGYTAQLNRADTFPLRLSPGQVVVPGLGKLTKAGDYLGRLSLYDGEFRQSGGGMTAITYVDESLDVMVIDVTGADPQVPQTAELRLWSPRKPQVLQQDKIGILAETWLDNQEAGATGETFGSLAAITADALNVHVEPSGPLSIKVTFLPRPDGSFRLLIGSPGWRGGDAVATASKLLAAAETISIAEHRVWWNHFWERPGLMKLSSPDHAAEYFENLRMIDIFTAAAESRDRLPGAQAGISDLFSSIRDGPIGVLALEPAHAGEREPGGRRLRVERLLLSPLSGKPEQCSRLDQATFWRPLRSLFSGNHALQRSRLRE